jgi:chemotaxis protein MotC
MRIAVYLMAGGLAILGATSAKADPAQPYEMARTLQGLQTQVAGGNGPAMAAQRTLLAEMEKRFLTADPSVWRDARNGRAAIIYTLSGGSPSVMLHLLGLSPLPEFDANLAHGALAYIEGREAEARNRLMPVDARTLPASLGGQVALVQAGLIARNDLPGASRLLDDARLLMPGTLVEEAALRRQVFIVAQMGDLDRFEFLSGQYLRRFNASVFASDFRQRFATALTRLNLAETSGHFQRLRELLTATDTDAQRATFLRVSRSAVIHGKIETARLAAAQAESLSTMGSSDGVRARLYGAAAGIVTEDFQRHSDDLNATNRRQLTEADAELRDAAITAAAAIRYWPSVEGQAESVATVLADPQRGSAWASPLMERADQNLSAASKLLQEAPRK